MSKTQRELIIENFQKEMQANIAINRPKLETNLYKFNRFVLNIDNTVSEKLKSSTVAEPIDKSKVKLSEVHMEMGRFIDDNKHKKKLMLIPRGHLKSTFTTVGRAVQAIVANPSVRILIANATYNLSCSFLSEIKKHLKSNKMLHMMWGDLTQNAEVWSNSSIQLNLEEISKQRPGLSLHGKKEPTVTAMGIESNMTSQHYDIMILDDLVNADYVNTEDQIQKTIDFYKEALNLLEPNGELIMIGTRWHDMDLYGYILDPDNNIASDFKVMVKKAYEGSLNQDEGFKALFPEKFSRKHLKKLYEQQGPYFFSCQYQNDPIPDEDADFKLDMFKYYDPIDLKGAQLNYFTTIDPAISTDKGADFTAMVTVAIDIYKNVYIREVVRKRLKPNELNDEIFRINREYNPILIGLEDVAYQKSLRYSLMEEMKKIGVYLPIKEVKPGHRNKDYRVKGLVPLYANGQIYHSKIMANNRHLEDELLRFPRGKHDDIVDALAYGLDIWFPPNQRVSRRQGKSKYLYNFNAGGE